MTALDYRNRLVSVASRLGQAAWSDRDLQRVLDVLDPESPCFVHLDCLQKKAYNKGMAILALLRLRQG